LVLLTALCVHIGPSQAEPPDPTDESFQKQAQAERTAIEKTVNETDILNKATIKVRSANVRKEPFLDAALTYVLLKGDVVSVIAVKGGWYSIEREDGKKGWAHQSLFLDSYQNQGADKKEPHPDSASTAPAKLQNKPAQPDNEAAKPEIVTKPANNDLMSLNFVNSDIRTALSALAMEREINISTSQDVSGNISVHLYNVTLKKALDAITRAGGFSYHKNRGLYYVYKPKEPRDPEAERLYMRIFKLKYADIDKVQEILEAIPGMRTIKIHEPSKTIIVEDTPQNIAKVRNLLAHWDKRPKQVMIEAKILEVELTDDMALGVNWEKILGDVRLGTGGFSSAILPTTGSVSPVPDTGEGIFGNILTGMGTRHQFSAALDALQTQTKIDTLSTPKIIALHGETAKVQVGGQQGYKVTSVSDGIQTESIEFIDTGTILEITPYIDDDGYILLDVAPSINSARIELGGIPVVKTTTVTTRLLVKNGETAFIGGLIQDTKNKIHSKIPVLGSIPGLGVLFRRTTDNIGKSELVVLITPTILNAEQNNVEQDAIEKTKQMERDFENEPLPMRKRLSEF